MGKKEETSSTATHPGGLTLSHARLRQLRPDLYGFAGLWRWIQIKCGADLQDAKPYLTRQLQRGDSRAAVVISAQPLLIAAYTDEMDCVALLRFSDEFTQRYLLRPGSRLLTVNFYGASALSRDLFAGPRNTGNWGSFHPVIADFLSEDMQRIEQRKAEITEDEWTRCEDMGKKYAELRPNTARDGRPMFANRPAVIFD